MRKMSENCLYAYIHYNYTTYIHYRWQQSCRIETLLSSVIVSIGMWAEVRDIYFNYNIFMIYYVYICIFIILYIEITCLEKSPILTVYPAAQDAVYFRFLQTFTKII